MTESDKQRLHEVRMLYMDILVKGMCENLKNINRMLPEYFEDLDACRDRMNKAAKDAGLLE